MPDITFGEDQFQRIPDPDEIMHLDPAFVELNGTVGQSFWELKDGEKYSDFEKRTASYYQRNAMFLWHCYKQSHNSWIDAYDMAPKLACLGAICSRGWLSDIESDAFADIADLLPYDTVQENIEHYDNLVQLSSFYARFSADMGEMLATLISQFVDQGAAWSLRVIFDETQKFFSSVKQDGADAYKALDEAVATAEADNSNIKTIGIADVDDSWWPVAMISLQGNVSDLDDEPEPENVELADFNDNLVDLLNLQAYIWADRSWNKVDEVIHNVLYGTLSYIQAVFGKHPEFSMRPDERAERLGELTEELQDDTGKVALRVNEDAAEEHLGQIRYPLDEMSSEFVALAQEEENYQRYNMFVHNALVFSTNLPACNNNLHKILLDECLRCLHDIIKYKPEKLDENLAQLDKHIRSIVESSSQANKSKWKKYLKANPKAAAAAKRKEAIVGFDDDYTPVFVSEIAMANFDDPDDSEEIAESSVDKD